MKIIDRYLLGEVNTPFFLALFVFILILLTDVIIRAVEIFITNKVNIFLIVQFLATYLPPILQISIPMAVLTGILIAFGRLSSDSEIIALRANGLSLFRMSVPVFFFSIFTWAACQYITVYGIPQMGQYRQEIGYKILESNINIGLKPHVFDDTFKDMVLYCEYLRPRTNNMEKVFLFRRPSQTPEIINYIFAESGFTQSFPDEKIIMFALQNGIIHEVNENEGTFSFTHFDKKTITIPIITDTDNREETIQKSDHEIYLSDLLREKQEYEEEIYRSQMRLVRKEYLLGKRQHTEMNIKEDNNRIEGLNGEQKTKKPFKKKNIRHLKKDIEEEQSIISELKRRVRKFEIVYHTKFAYPIACIVFVLVGIPLGIRYRTRGKSTGFSLSMVLILIYYIIIMTGEGMAREGRTPAWIGIWAANIILFVIGCYVFFMVSREKPFSIVQFIQWKVSDAIHFIIHKTRVLLRREPQERPVKQHGLFFNNSFPRILDLYVSREFFNKFMLMCFIIIAITLILEFITQVRGFIKYDAHFVDFITYILLRIPFFLVLSIHMAVLITTILTINILSRNNELTAMKACGVSLYRASIPIFVIAFFISFGVLFFNERVVPQTNSLAEEIMDYKIKKRSKPSLFTHNKNWYRGSHNSIYSFSSFDQREDRNVLNDFLLYNLDQNFLPDRKIMAHQVKWDKTNQCWYYLNGTVTYFDQQGRPAETQPFNKLQAQLTEDVSEFRREIKDSDKMNYRELKAYVSSLRNKGIDTTLYRTDLLAKISMPFISFVIALFGIPFAITFQRSGTLVGIGFSIFIGMVYFVAYRLGISLGHGNQLPPFLAAWGPNLLFIAIGLYLIFRART